MKEKSLSKIFFLFSLILIVGIVPTFVLAQKFVFNKQASVQTAFTYQGYLSDGSAPANSEYDFKFALYNDKSGGSQIGDTVNKNGVTVTEGIFSVSLDFGEGAFNGENRWLEVKVSTAGDNDYETLSPRSGLSAVPYAMYSFNTAALQGNTVSETAPTDGQVLQFDGTEWAPADGGSGGGSVGVPSGYIIFGTTDIPPTEYTYTGDMVNAQGTNVSTYKDDLPETIYGAGVVSYNNEIYVIGGHDGYLDTASSNIYRYSPRQNVWDLPTSNLRTKRECHGAAVVNDKIYAFGGIDDRNTTLDSTEVIDVPTRHQTSFIAALNTPRYDFATVVHGTDIYILGGYDYKGAPLRTVEKLDTVSGTSAPNWDVANDLVLDTGLAGAGAAVIGDKLYVIGGATGNAGSNGCGELVSDALESRDDVYQIDLNNPSGWIPMNNMPLTRHDVSVSVVNNIIYVFGGQRLHSVYDAFAHTNSVYSFNPVNDEWDYLYVMNTAQRLPGTVVVEVDGKEKIYVVGGLHGGLDGSNVTPLSSLEEYTPPVFFYAHRKD